MKIASSIYSIKQLQERIAFIDSAIIMVPNMSYIFEDINIDEAISLCKQNNVEVILSISRVFMQNEIENVKSFILAYKDYKFLASDNGLLEIFIELGLQDHLIYDPSTLVCNSMDLQFYSSLGYDSVGMSNEITLADIKEAYEKTSANIFYHIFGRKLMFYSRRKLISCYKDEKELQFSNSNLSLREATRQFNIPVFENENGTYCYRQYLISLLPYLSDISFIKYGYLESVCLDDETFLKVLEIYHNFIKNGEKLEICTEKLAKLSLNIEDGFAFSDTSHIKEKE